MDEELLFDPVRIHAEKHPGRIAVYEKERAIPYSDLWDMVQRFGLWLGSRFETRSRIGMMLSNSWEAVVAYYGISYAGMIAVPLDIDMHPRNVSYIVRDCGICVFITDKKRKTTLSRDCDLGDMTFILKEGSGDEAVIADHFLPDIVSGSGMLPAGALNIHTEDTVVILYTTGTTGPRKGVMLSHGNLQAAVKNINTFMGFTDDIIESLPMRLSHSFGFARMRCVFETGGTVILENGLLRPELVLMNMMERKSNSISSVPAGFSIFLEMFPELFLKVAPNIRYIEIGSDFMKRKHKEMLVQMCPNARICMHYGLTEASRAAFIDFRRDWKHLDTVGRPSPNVKIKIADDAGGMKEADRSGEILIRGDMIMNGYWGKPGLTRTCFSDGWFHTGDTGFFDSDGYLHLMGRKEEILNVGGMKIAPGEIEKILLKYDNIKEAAVVAINTQNSLTPKIIKAFIVLKDEKKSVGLQDLRKFCLKEMEGYKIPQALEILSELPKTDSGKIKRLSLLSGEQDE